MKKNLGKWRKKLKNIPVLKDKGNILFRENMYEDDANTYVQAIGIIEQLMLAYVWLKKKK